MTKIKVIIPAYNEEPSIAKVVGDIPYIVDEIVVVSNGSTDNTEEEAKNAGATVLTENNKGYGYACLKGINYLTATKPPDILVFMDGDYADYPEELVLLVDPILKNEVDFVVGSRGSEKRQKKAMTPQQIFGNALACFLMRILYGSRFTDLGPFRAIRWSTLVDLAMQDKTYGWTVEMQLKVLRKKIKYKEIPVRYRERIGVSKVSGTIKGTIFAGMKIIGWIFKHLFS